MFRTNWPRFLRISIRDGGGKAGFKGTNCWIFEIGKLNETLF